MSVSGTQGTGSNDWLQRFWRKDPSLWSGDSAVQAQIAQRLGWLEAAAFTRSQLAAIEAFVAQVNSAGVQQCVLLGMGGSSLAPEVLAQCFGAQAGGPQLRILDTTHPDAIRAFAAQLPIADTLFIVSSKSGTTAETMALYQHFFAACDERGEQFVAITDPGSPLQELAEAQGFRQLFENPADIGGRYAALSLVGMVPAALAGIDVARVLDSAERAAQACRQPAAIAQRLGQAMAEHTAAGRDKLTLTLSPTLAPLGAWIEQLVAESTGKQGVGVVAVADETLLSAQRYNNDRFFVHVELADGDDQQQRALAELERSGHPVFRYPLSNLYELGAAFFHWEFATAVASAALHINPFDEPDVNSAKQRTRALLAQPPEHTLPIGYEDQQLTVYGAGDATLDLAGVLEQWLAQCGDGDYLAILAYLPSASWSQLCAVRESMRQRHKAAVTLALGPRYLHSSGQLHKGGANNGVFLMITDDPVQDLAIPGEDHSFGQLIHAQALGDMAVLLERDRRVLHIHLRQREQGLAALLAALDSVSS